MDLSWAPSDACTLPTDDRLLRGAEFDVLFARYLHSVERLSDTRLVITLEGSDVATLTAVVQDLTARESECCSFFTFAVSQPTGAAHTVEVVVDLPVNQRAVLDSLGARAEQFQTRTG